MKASEKLKKLFEKQEDLKAGNERIIESARKRVEEELSECRESKKNALFKEDMNAYKKARNRETELIQEIEYYQKLGKEKEQYDEEEYKALLSDLKKETNEEYKKAAEECIAAIEHLETVSKKAECIIKEYYETISFYKSHIAKTSNTTSIPETYPNTIAVGLANKLQYQKNELKRFIES